MFVSEILKSKGSRVISALKTETLTSVIATLATHKIGAVPVLNESGTIEGILSERDIIRALATNPQALSDPIARHMTKNVVTCAPDYPVSDVMSVMTKRRFRHIPVVKDHKLIGLVSIGDIVKAHIDEIEQEKGQIMSYIASA